MNIEKVYIPDLREEFTHTMNMKHKAKYNIKELGGRISPVMEVLHVIQDTPTGLSDHLSLTVSPLGYCPWMQVPNFEYL